MYRFFVKKGAVSTVRELDMCEFCTKHGEGKKWYLQMKNYSEELLHQEMSPAQQAVAGVPTRHDWGRKFLVDFTLRAVGVTLKEKSPELAVRRPSKRAIRQEIPNREMFVHFGQVLPIEDVEQALDLAASITRMPCGCRYFMTGKENCRYCFGFAIERFGASDPVPDSSASLEVMDRETAMAIIRKFDQEGLFHSIWTGNTPYIIGVCNCDRDCGAYHQTFVTRGSPDMFRAEYIGQTNWDLCNGCKSCMRQCQFGAMFYSSALKKVSIDPTRCYGCGVCRAACTKDAISLVPRESQPLSANLWLK